MSEKNISFEQAMERLDAAVKALESGSLGLDDAMKTYEEAVGLLRLCHTALEDAERRVSILLDKGDGNLAEAPFDAGNEA